MWPSHMLCPLPLFFLCGGDSWALFGLPPYIVALLLKSVFFVLLLTRGVMPAVNGVMRESFFVLCDCKN